MDWKCLVFILMALTASPQLVAAAGQDWFRIEEDKESSFFYDRNGTTRAREGVVRVTTRVVYTELGRKEAVKVLKGLPEPARLHESRYVHEIDCIEREGRLLSATHFDQKGAILRSSDLDPVTIPEYLPSGSRMAVVADQACGR